MWKRNVSFSCKVKSWDAVTDRQSLYRYSSANWLNLNVIYHLDNTSMPYDPFSSVDVRAAVCNQDAIFNLVFSNSGHRSTQVITGQLYIFYKNWHRAWAVVT